MNRIAALIALVVVLPACGGPLGPLAGGRLSGSEATAPPGWAGVDVTEGIALETLTADGKAHSVNTWAVIVDGDLYVPTSLILGSENPEERSWVQNVMRNEQVRVRAGATVYPGVMRRSEDAELIGRVKATLLARYEEEASAHSERAWVYQVNPR